MIFHIKYKLKKRVFSCIPINYKCGYICETLLKSRLLCDRCCTGQRSRGRSIFCWGTWARGCLSEPAPSTVASGEQQNVLKLKKNNVYFILNNFRLFFIDLFHYPPVSISALQWLCNADKRTHSPPKRLYTFFSTLYSSLVRFTPVELFN